MGEIPFLPAAWQELLAAVDHYDAVSPGLGAEFITEVERAIDRITAFPDHGSPYFAMTRRVILHRFPLTWFIGPIQNYSSSRCAPPTEAVLLAYASLTACQVPGLRINHHSRRTDWPLLQRFQHLRRNPFRELVHRAHNDGTRDRRSGQGST